MLQAETVMIRYNAGGGAENGGYGDAAGGGDGG
jgi:hypothetical protein